MSPWNRRALCQAGLYALSSVWLVGCLYDVPAPAKLNLFLHITGRRARWLPPAAVGLHADRLVRHAALRIARDGRITREDLGPPHCPPTT
jgi:hypothetical protein